MQDYITITPTVIHALRVNVKSLASEGRHIRREVQRANDPAARSALRWHRVGRVRPEARLAQLCLAWCRGRKYLQVEPRANSMPNVDDMVRKLKRVGVWCSHPTYLSQQLSVWLEEGHASCDGPR